ncbi:MAG: M15 family metallopeptidase [Clostridia bacterium]|nr:M15 family metallopeptidase [Clostridia bacterium]
MKKQTAKYNGTQKFILFCFFAIVLISVTITGLLLWKAFAWSRNAEEGDIPSTLTEVLPDSQDVKDTLSSILPGTGTKEPEADETEPETEPVPEEDVPDPHVLEQQREEWYLLLVNKWNPIDRDYSLDLVELRNGHAVDIRAYPDLQDMMDDARAEGLQPIICSSYRTNQRQRDLFKNQVDKYLALGLTEEEAEEQAAKWVAVPGTSEHQTGLAVDIVALDYQILDEGQEDTPEQKWLMENSYKYGYILRYPTEKSDLTGIHYEPWHYRYVGKEVAKEIYDLGICLEEYLMK